MRRILIFTVMLFLLQYSGFSQQKFTFEEDFDGVNPMKFTAMQQGTWVYNTSYSLPSLSGASVSRSYLGFVPQQMGDTVILQSTSAYDFEDYDYITLSFHQICKLSPSDIAKVQYRMSGNANWFTLDNADYLGSAGNYNTKEGFNATSYAEWDANDSTVIPLQSWWKKETFDLGSTLHGFNGVEFRFIIIRGNSPFTDVSFGWLLENIQLTATDYIVGDPIVEFVYPLVQDTIYNTGPFTITARAKTVTNAPLVQPWLTYTVSEQGGQPATDSVLMTSMGNDLWQATIPQSTAEVMVDYSITAKDANGNTAKASSKYIVKYVCGIIDRVADYTYTGDVQVVTLAPGTYELECWGANGGTDNNSSSIKGGTGGYSKGTYTVDTWTNLYLYVGGEGKSSNTALTVEGGWNGGGRGIATGATAAGKYKGGGGGGTDIRTSKNNTYSDRIIVAGGGGGIGGTNAASLLDGAGGGNQGEGAINNDNNGKGGTQTAGGTGGGNGSFIGTDGILGIGGDAYTGGSSSLNPGGGGGGGYYGGGGGAPNGGGGGGSGYIGGVTDSITVQVGGTGFIANPVADGNGLIRITTLSVAYNCSNNSAAVSSIDIPDTVETRPSARIPIVLTLKNTGISGLDSITVSYSVNGSTPVTVTKYFTPAVSWTHSSSDTLGEYTPHANSNDTIKVWVSMPNGQIDSNPYDDTLTKLVYGKSDLLAAFVDPPASIVNTVGPHQIKLGIESISGATLPANVALNVSYTYDGATTSEILAMQLDASDNLWKASIPKKAFNTNVVYSTTLTDASSNNITLSNTYYIQRSCEGTLDGCDSSASVELVSIDSPEAVAPVGNAIPVRITLRNKGIPNLDSCYINWSRNGVLDPNTTIYKRNSLATDFTDTVTIGSYTPATEGYDTIVVWVSMPNGRLDLVRNDDTLRVMPCKVVLSGNHLIGEGGTFRYLTDAIQSIRNCGVGGDVVLQLKGNHSGVIDLYDLSQYMNGYTLTLTSYDNHPDSATITAATIAGIRLNNSNNIVIKGITVNVSTAATAIPAIQFTGSCTNIVIRDCRLLGDTTTTQQTTAYAVISKLSSAGIVDNISIIRNFIDGGSAGIWFDAGALVSSVVVDSNRLTNSYHRGSSFSNANYKIRYNTVLSRTTATKTAWTALEYNNTNYEAIGNRIIQCTTAITSPVGILVSITKQTGINKALIANNEIILYNSVNGNGYAGIHLTTVTPVSILNNSINIRGKYGRGIYINNPNAKLSVKNNNIIIESNQSTAAPIYLYGITNLSQWDIDYNNMYSPNRIGYAGSSTNSFTKIEDWQKIVTSDSNSKSIPLNFAGASSLEISNADSRDLLCDVISPVTYDINNSPRIGRTTMGCYDNTYAVNAILDQIVELSNENGPIQSEDIKVVVYNMGSEPVTSVNIEWSIDDVSQGNNDYPVSLAKGDSTTIKIGVLSNPAAQFLTLKAWINTIKNNTVILADENKDDDTTSRSVVACNGGYEGIVQIGNTGDFSTVEKALEALAICGISNDITFAFEPGNYRGIDLSGSSTLFDSHHLTITSTTSNAEDVSFSSSGEAVIILNNSHNISLKDVTVDASAGTFPAIQFTGACTNVVVRDCRLLGNTTDATSSVTNAPVSKAAGTGIVDSISFIKNLIDGGYYGFYFIGGTSANAYGTHIVFDSNTLSNQFHYAFHPCSTAFSSVSHNTILSRESTTDAVWYGMRLAYCSGPVTGNTIRQRTTEITQPIGIELQYYNSTANRGLIANNEISLHTTSTTGTYGVYVNNDTYADILHNSILVHGTEGRGIHVVNSPATKLSVKNNNIVLQAPATQAYPIYLQTVTYVSSWDFDYNNMYAPVYIAYTGNPTNGIFRHATVASWQAEVQSDKNSVSVLPVFINSDTLKLASYNDSLECPLNNTVLTDKEGKNRLSTTIMGAYSSLQEGLDLRMLEITPWYTEAISGQNLQIYADITNGAVEDISSATFGWSLNGEVQATGITVPISPALTTFEQRNISIDNFTVTDAIDNYNIAVWVESVNGQADILAKNDTANASVQRMPLAEFVDPFIKDTINSLSFTVNVNIRNYTGAPVNTPELYIETILGGSCSIHNYDTITMEQTGDIWAADVPRQYYNSKVIYTLHVSDALGNAIVIMDSVYIRFNSDEGGDLYDDNHLAIFDLLSPPANSQNSLCLPDYLPAQIQLSNIGNNDYDFTQDNIAIGYEIINSWGPAFRGEIAINTGVLLSGESQMVELMPDMPVLAGKTTIKAWVTSAIDHFNCDDTLSVVYSTPKISLPLRENFNNGIPSELIPSIVDGNSTWERYEGSATIQPDSGSAMIRFNGNTGSRARLSTGQLDLYQAVNPYMEFWYYHDSLADINDYSWTDVNIVINGEPENLDKIYLRNPKGNFGWTPYRYYLNNYTTGDACLLIQFESLNKYQGTAQYIDYIRITSEPDAVVSEIIITPAPVLCSPLGSDISVVIKASRAESIIFENTDSLKLDINGSIYTVSLQGKTIAGNSSETIPVLSNFIASIGTTAIKAYFSSPVDKMPANDTAKTSIVITPRFSIAIEKLSGSNPATAEFDNYQEVSIKNTGNMELPNIGLILTVDDESGYHFTAKTTLGQSLSPGDSIEVAFPQAYKVPWSLNYTVTVHGYLLCDSAMVNTTASVLEEVNITDLYIVDIISPLKDTVDMIDSLVEVSISVRNRNLGSVYAPGVKVWLLITDTTGAEQQIIEEELPYIAGIAPIPYTFTEKYTVPALPKYHLTVYIENKDSYAYNDTMRMVRQAKSGSVSIVNPKGASFTMEQNMPNPAKGNAIINYSIPQDGEITFQLYSASGQLLYTEQASVPLGEHQIKLNTSDYASGIYFYTMEYKGRRISKRMSITR